jgi:hypothetical protein
MGHTGPFLDCGVDILGVDVEIVGEKLDGAFI